MLKTISKSTNRKLGPCASTYRAGTGNNYATCPSSCPLKPAQATGSVEVDQAYLETLLNAVPEGGLGWTYSHFGPGSIPLPQSGQTVINLSADDVNEAREFVGLGYPTTLTVSADADGAMDKAQRIDGLRIVRCPAETSNEINCHNCGGDVPLCARGDRDYVIKFTAHGTQAKLVGKQEAGGCYGSGGPVAIHWSKTSRQEQPRSDSEVLDEWIKTLPRGTKVRHHVVGDLGLQT